MKFVSREYDFADDDPPVVIGEIGVNHNGNVELARRLVDVAVDAGVHIVKFQAFKTEKEISRFAALTPYQQETSPDATSQYDLCKALELSSAAFRDLKRYCEDREIGFLCSVFDNDSLDFLVDELKVDAVKIGSGEITNLPFLERIGSRKLGAILSTGASTLVEVSRAIEALRRGGCPELVLLHCVTSYPAPVDQLNLRAMAILKQEFELPVGFSDHSIGIDASIAAVALGAVAVEKHFTLDRNMEGPDHRASLEPDELKRLVDVLRLISESLGDGIKRPMPCEIPNVPLVRRSLVANGPLRKGVRLTSAMIEIKRPADGIEPADLDKVIGRTLRLDLADDEPITWASLE